MRKFDSEAQHIEHLKADLKKDAEDLLWQAEKANAAIRFMDVKGGQWEDFLIDEYSNRTKLELDITSGFVHRFIGEWNQNRLGVEFKPDGDSTTDDDAEMLNGIYRADFRQNSGKMAVDNAVQEASKCGYGAFKICPQYEDE